MIEYFSAFPLYIQCIAAVFVVTFLVQLGYYIWFRGIAGHRHSRKGEPTSADPCPVSIVLIVENQSDYIEDYLPLFLDQQYSAPYEVVVVSDCSDEATINILEDMAARVDNFKFSAIRPDPRFKHSRKLALNVGIKAATYDNILIVDTDAYPASERWLSLMARGFDRGQIVIGYTGIEPRRGVINKLIRCERLFISMRYLAMAIHGKPYRGIYNNMGISRSLYMSSRGFNFQRLHIGDDDLYIQSIASKTRFSTIINQGASMKQFQDGGWKWWRNYMKYYSSTYKRYPTGTKYYVFMELASRLLFFGSAVVLLTSGVQALWISAVVALVLRWVFVLTVVRRICRRLGEKHIVQLFMIYDIISILSEITLYIRRTVRPSKEIWIQ